MRDKLVNQRVCGHHEVDLGDLTYSDKLFCSLDIILELLQYVFDILLISKVTSLMIEPDRTFQAGGRRR